MFKYILKLNISIINKTLFKNFVIIIMYNILYIIVKGNINTANIVALLKYI